ncbi:hypothetical protein niasHT_013695 [Heterodera trifolii]|uniref:Peptidase S1 domain-containing protein n=1 Tax=Heterodera trifolii TaxID=157864 RepID=A0ABD2LE14_9BILA
MQPNLTTVSSATAHAQHAAADENVLRFPWLVFVRAFRYCTADTKKFLYKQCAGVLISPSHVLTSAFCVRWQMRNHTKECFDLSDLLIGEEEASVKASHVLVTLNTDNAKDRGISWQMDKMSIHGSFDLMEREPRRFDIAIIQLEDWIDWQKYGIAPICLTRTLFAAPDDLHGLNATIVGWEVQGSVGKNIQDGNIRQQREQITILSNEHCKEKLRTVKKDEHNPQIPFLCANLTKNAFLNTHGNPIQLQKNGRFYLLGLSTGGTKSDGQFNAEMPEFYTNVLNYCEFISANSRYEGGCNMARNSNCGVLKARENLTVGDGAFEISDESADER